MALSALRGIRRGSLFPKVQDFTRDLWYAHSDRDLPYFSAHDLRHLHASRLLHDGLISPAQIAARLGAEVTWHRRTRFNLARGALELESS